MTALVHVGPTCGKPHQVLAIEGSRGQHVLVQAEGTHAFYVHRFNCEFIASPLDNSGGDANARTVAGSSGHQLRNLPAGQIRAGEIPASSAAL